VGDEETYDPLEKVNRVVFGFNEGLDRWVLKPAAKGYRWVTPSVVQTGISNFFSNLRQPIVIVNDFLQGKGRQGGADTTRFLLNTTVGIGGFFDVARKVGLEPHDEDFGQTFAVWGMSEGPYIVWPILGGRSLRDSAGWVGDQFAYPLNYLDNDSTYWSLWTLDLVHLRAGYMDQEKALETAASQDKYLFIREAYRQNRRNLIYDGNPPRPKFFDEDENPNSNGSEVKK
jgi:phospholipid-binding lipoprotein MlaA